jgi:hypothetical protein
MWIRMATAIATEASAASILIEETDRRPPL